MNISFFEKLKKEAAKRGPNLTPVFLSSHPPIEERIKRVEEEIARNPGGDGSPHSYHMQTNKL